MRIFIVLFMATGLSFAANASDAFYRVPVSRNEIKIMAYNVQNLFDADHDENKRDYEFLPKSSPLKKYCSSSTRTLLTTHVTPFNLCEDTDWTDTHVEWKLEQIQIALAHQGRLPDILVLSEVENPAVVSRLADLLGYDGFYMTESPDVRGIDLAILFSENKLEAIGFSEAVVEDSNYPTRNASAAHFKLTPQLGSDVIGIYPVHWPSQRGPASERVKAAKAVRKLINKEKRRHISNGKYHAIVLGDFNVVDADSPNPLQTILDKSWSPKFRDVHSLAVTAKHPYIDRMPKGTYYYGTETTWNHFDRLLVTADLDDGEGLDVSVDSYRIHAPMAISKENDAGERIPFRYNHRTNSKRWLGFSDHYAVHVKLRFE